MELYLDWMIKHGCPSNCVWAKANVKTYKISPGKTEWKCRLVCTNPEPKIENENGKVMCKKLQLP